ncbi:MAG TPA: STAS domain-containing protein [Actinomycetota bacterium]|jgi:anti-sigma B factor antagonist|nr:STAS domain-containing protein [Actinomycetota bacterium]
MADPFEIVQLGPNMYFLGGELDMVTAPRVEAATEASVRAGGPLLLDLSAVSFVDSTGIRVFLTLARTLGDKGCVLLHAPQERVRRVLELVRITDVANVHLESCKLVAYPEKILDWSPAPDLAERFDALRSYEREATPT